MAVIYRLVCKPTKAAYIGFTSTGIAKRFREHRCNLRKGRHQSKKLQAAWEEHGEDAFEIKILKSLSHHIEKDERRTWEQYFIDFYEEMDLLLNDNPNAFGPPPGAQAKAAAARVANGYRQTKESNEKRRMAQLGIPKNHGHKISATKRKKC